MSFSPAFGLLAILDKKAELPALRRDLTAQDLYEIAMYLGITVDPIDGKEIEQHLESVLENQNRFLTNHLYDNDIEQSREYRNSTYIREIYENNRLKC